jgi:hypothetical protein
MDRVFICPFKALCGEYSRYSPHIPYNYRILCGECAVYSPLHPTLGYMPPAELEEIRQNQQAKESYTC